MKTGKIISTDIDPKNLKKLGTVAGIISLVIIAYYGTGLYRNYLQIKKLREEGSKPLQPEDE